MIERKSWQKIMLWIIGVVASTFIGISITKIIEEDPELLTYISSSFNEDKSGGSIRLNINNFGEVDLNNLHIAILVSTHNSSTRVRLDKNNIRLFGDNACNMSFKSHQSSTSLAKSLPDVIELRCQNLYKGDSIDLDIPIINFHSKYYQIAPFSDVLLVIASNEYKYQTMFDGDGTKRYEETGKDAMSPNLVGY